MGGPGTCVDNGELCDSCVRVIVDYGCVMVSGWRYFIAWVHFQGFIIQLVYKLAFSFYAEFCVYSC